jgi:hypothetical protein
VRPPAARSALGSQLIDLLPRDLLLVLSHSDDIMKGWREDPVFAPYYHEVGRVSLVARTLELAASAMLTEGSYVAPRSRRLTARPNASPTFGGRSRISSGATLRSARRMSTSTRGKRLSRRCRSWPMPTLTCVSPLLQPLRPLLTAFLRVSLQGWEAYWVPDGGWVAAVDTIDSVGRELERLGVKTVWGKCVPALVLSSPCRPSDVFC